MTADPAPGGGARASLSLSVVIPCFNAAAYIGEALASVRAQTAPVDEIVVVDDGSTDGGAEVVRRLAPDARLISQPNQGIGAARNAGVRAASGEAIAFLDADDVWPADSLAVRLEALNARAGLGCVYGFTEQFLSPDLNEADRARLHCPSERSLARQAGAMLIRREVFDAVGLFDPALAVGEFVDWVARLAETEVAVAPVEALVLRRRIHASNTSIRLRSKRADYLQVIKASLDRRAAAAAGRAS